ncbi:hypothetical protein VYU27_006039 [Nannochloropsis oceanica]
MVWGAQAALAVAASGKRSEMVLTLLSPSPSTRTVAPPPPHMRRRPEDNYSSGHMPSKSNSSRGAYGGGMPQAGPGRPSNYYSMPEDRVRESSRNMFEDENNRRIADLAGQVSMLKELTIDIGTEVRSQNTLLDDMGNGFSRTDGLMGSTMRRLNKMLTTSSSRHMLWLVVFIVFVFIFVYYIIRHKG